MFIYCIINVKKKSELWLIIYIFFSLNKKQKATTNLINKKDNKCPQYTVTVTLNYKKVEKNPETITKLNLLLTNITGALNVLYVKKEKKYLGFISKHKSNCEKQVITLTIRN